MVQSIDGRIKVPINEATEKESQVQEFVDRMKGPGVQHLALLTTGIIGTLMDLRENGFQFLSIRDEVTPRTLAGVHLEFQSVRVFDNV